MQMNTLFSLTGFDNIFSLLIQTQQAIPDTSSYMVAGFVVIFGAIFVYLASLIIRWRNLQRDLEILKELEKSQAIPHTSARPLKTGSSTN
jgi:CcmD family protein